MKLPKQWLHWARKAKLRREYGRGIEGAYYLVGRGRRWRVNSRAIFECSCPLEYFDRWANSRGAAMEGIPKTEAEFLRDVETLIEQSKDAR